jgi:hypothetical protein
LEDTRVTRLGREGGRVCIGVDRLDQLGAAIGDPIDLHRGAIRALRTQVRTYRIALRHVRAAGLDWIIDDQIEGALSRRLALARFWSASAARERTTSPAQVPPGADCGKQPPPVGTPIGRQLRASTFAPELAGQ